MITVRPYRAGDPELMPPRPCEAGIEAAERAIEPIRLANPAWTLLDDGAAIAAAGVIILRKGVGEAWLRGSTRMAAWPCTVARTVKLFLDAIAHDHELHRVQAIVAAENLLAHKFAAWLGFEFEGRLEAFGEDGRDFLMMAKRWHRLQPVFPEIPQAKACATATSETQAEACAIREARTR